MCHIIQILLTLTNVWAHSDDVGQLERLLSGIKQLALHSRYSTNTWGRCFPPRWHLVLRVFAHASTCAVVKHGKWISDAEAESLWHSRVKAIVGEKSTSRRPFRHVWRTVQSCSFGWSPWQRWDVKAPRGNGCSGAFWRQSSSSPYHGNSDRRWIYSDLCTEPTLPPAKKPHSEVFHVSVFNVHSMQCVGAV